MSDPIDLTVEPRGVISVSMFLESGQQGLDITSHPLSMTTSFFIDGNAVNKADFTGAASAEHWYERTLALNVGYSVILIDHPQVLRQCGRGLGTEGVDYICRPRR